MSNKKSRKRDNMMNNDALINQIYIKIYIILYCIV